MTRDQAREGMRVRTVDGRTGQIVLTDYFPGVPCVQLDGTSRAYPFLYAELEPEVSQ